MACCWCCRRLCPLHDVSEETRSSGRGASSCCGTCGGGFASGHYRDGSHLLGSCRRDGPCGTCGCGWPERAGRDFRWLDPPAEGRAEATSEGCKTVPSFAIIASVSFGLHGPQRRRHGRVKGFLVGLSSHPSPGCQRAGALMGSVGSLPSRKRFRLSSFGAYGRGGSSFMVQP